MEDFLTPSALLLVALYVKIRLDKIDSVLEDISLTQEDYISKENSFEQDLNTRLESLQNMRFSPMTFRQGVRRNLRDE